MLRDGCVVENEVCVVGEMLECAHCGALASVASRLCPTCGEPFVVHPHDAADGDTGGESAEQQADSMHVQNPVLLEAGDTSLSSSPPIPNRRIVLLSVNFALLIIWIALLFRLPEHLALKYLAPSPTATVTRLATDIPSNVTPTRSASPTPTGSSVGVHANATATSVPRPSATATATVVATETPLPAPPTVQPLPPLPAPTH